MFLAREEIDPCFSLLFRQYILFQIFWRNPVGYLAALLLSRMLFQQVKVDSRSPWERDPGPRAVAGFTEADLGLGFYRAGRRLAHGVAAVAGSNIHSVRAVAR